MIKVKDGYAKLIGTTYAGSPERVLLSNGGDFGLHTGRNNEANKLVRTDASGYIQAGQINTTSGDMGTTAITRIYCSNDNFIRYKTPANFFSTLTNDDNQLSITVGSQNRKLTIGYATTATSIGSGALKHMCSLRAGDSYNAYKIITNWHKSWNIMPTINIRGYAYGSSSTIDCDIVMYHYSNNPCNYSLTNKGSYAIRVWQAIENDVQVFYINPGTYFGMFNVFVYSGTGTESLSGWSMTTVSEVSGTEISKNAIATSITGNAATANKWTTARTLTIGATGKLVNGSGNVSWTLAELGASSATHTHNVTINGTTKTIATSGGTAVDLGSYLPLSGGTMTGILYTAPSRYDTVLGNNGGIGAIHLNNSDITGVNAITTSDVSDSWTESLAFKRSNGNWDTFRATNGIFYFGVNNGTEYVAIHSGNYTAYTVTKTGGGASGTWGINITGNAATATILKTTLLKSSDTLNSHLNGLYSHINANDPTGSYITNALVLSLTNRDYDTWQFCASANAGANNLAYRRGAGNTFYDWVPIITASNIVNYNAGSATYASTVTLTADNATNATRFILFSDAATGNQRAKTDTGLKYNPSSNTITATLAGNAATATKVVANVTGTNTIELVRATMADNDHFRILVGGTATNAGYVEIATADDGTEPIYVRQYSGVFTSVRRTATLLDASGNTSFPGTVTASGFIKNGSSNSYVLLGGGGHKAVSDFATKSHTHSYLPLSG